MNRLLALIKKYSIENIIESRAVNGGTLHNCVLTNGTMLYVMETHDKFVFSYDVVKNDLFDQCLVNPHETINKQDLFDEIWDKLEYNKSQFTNEQLERIYYKMRWGYDFDAMKTAINPSFSPYRITCFPSDDWPYEYDGDKWQWVADTNNSDRLVEEVLQLLYSGASKQRMLSWDYSKYSDDDAVIIARSIRSILTDDQIHELLSMNISFKEKNKLRIQWAKRDKAIRKQVRQQQTTG